MNDVEATENYKGSELPALLPVMSSRFISR
jgi:hypothetical protein